MRRRDAEGEAAASLPLSRACDRPAMEGETMVMYVIHQIQKRDFVSLNPSARAFPYTLLSNFRDIIIARSTIPICKRRPST